MHALFSHFNHQHYGLVKKLESFQEGGLPSNLHSFQIQNCNKLTARRREWDFQRLPSLKHLTLGGEYVEESFSEKGLLPSTLTSFCIEFVPNLKSLNNRGLSTLWLSQIHENYKLPSTLIVARRTSYSLYATNLQLPNAKTSLPHGGRT